MSRKILSLFAFILGFSLLIATPTFATDNNTNAITVSGDEDPSTGSNEVYDSDQQNQNVATTTEANNTAPETPPNSADCDQTSDGNCLNSPAERYDTESNVLDAGLANEPEVICATGNEPGCDRTPNSELKPLYISLAALGATILLVIIINLASRKKNRIRSDS